MLSEKPWNLEKLIRLLMGILASCFFLSLIGLLAQHFSGQHKAGENSFLELFFLTMSLQGSIVFVTGGFLWLHQTSWREAFGFSARGLAYVLLLGTAAALIFLPVGELLQALSIKAINLLQLKTAVQPAVETLDAATSPLCRRYLIFFYVSIGPMGEEILFRGILYPVIKQMGFPRIALWGSSIAFAAIHANLPTFLPLVFLSLVSVWLYERTNNLLASIAMHGMFNGIQIVFMYYSDSLVQTFHHWLNHSPP